MSELNISTAEIMVHLERPGVGTREYCLPAGATLADLLRLSETSVTNQAVFVDGAAPEEVLPLRDGAVVTIVPPSRNATGDEPWRGTIPAFRDEALFQEYSDVLKARRVEVNPDDEGQVG